MAVFYEYKRLFFLFNYIYLNYLLRKSLQSDCEAFSAVLVFVIPEIIIVNSHEEIIPRPLILAIHIQIDAQDHQHAGKKVSEIKLIKFQI